MPTEVIYARVPETLKDAADAYASERGATLPKAVADLLDRGLSSASDERSVAELERHLAQITAEKAAAEAELLAARTELGAVKSLAQRAGRALGTCPSARRRSRATTCWHLDSARAALGHCPT